jgi:hypothetical protein
MVEREDLTDDDRGATKPEECSESRHIACMREHGPVIHLHADRIDPLLYHNHSN